MAAPGWGLLCICLLWIIIPYKLCQAPAKTLTQLTEFHLRSQALCAQQLTNFTCSATSRACGRCYLGSSISCCSLASRWSPLARMWDEQRPLQQVVHAPRR